MANLMLDESETLAPLVYMWYNIDTSIEKNDSGGAGNTPLSWLNLNRRFGMTHSTRAQDSSQEALSDVASKPCSRCGETKTLSEFFRNRASSNGLMSACKECIYQYKQQHYKQKRSDILTNKKQYYTKNKARIAERRRNPQALARHRAVSMAYRRANVEKMNAQNAVNRAITRGKLPEPEACACAHCGCQATDYHHQSYESTQWLNVTPLCHSCHMKIHVGVSG